MVERAEIEAELIVVRASIEAMIEHRPGEGFDAFDEQRYEELTARETVLIGLLRSTDH